MKSNLAAADSTTLLDGHGTSKDVRINQPTNKKQHSIP